MLKPKHQSMSSIEQAYQHCLELAANHYENFPVASRLLPAQLRRPVAVIYSFARSADDFADEGKRSPSERLQLLEGYSDKLKQIEAGITPQEDRIFLALADIIHKHHLPLQLFHDLLHAFKMDVSKQRFANFSEIAAYCRYSANPVGRLLLHLHHKASAKNLAYSDSICTALQLINFYQDMSQDYHENNRIYLPVDEMQQYKVNEQHIAQARSDKAMRQLMQKQYQRAADYLNNGSPLGSQLKGRFGLEIRMIIAGGERVLKKLNDNLDNLFVRPRLNRYDGLCILLNALLTR